MNITIKDSTILNDDQTIGTLAGDTVYLTKAIGPSYKAEVKRLTGKTELKFVIGAAPGVAPGAAAVTAPPATILEGPKSIPITPPVVPVGNSTQLAPLPAVSEEPPVQAAPSPSKPVHDPEPKQHPSFGRKDPAWIAWKNRQ